MSDDFELAMGSDMVELAKTHSDLYSIEICSNQFSFSGGDAASRSNRSRCDERGTRSDSVCSVEVEAEIMDA